ncbi:hypothetical protein STRCI_002995 [Streptomyces cinnabarinus]|uniref:Semialdehyde dehydrogenase NAD-binding domain-containing protein n=1 Tax=Streptomyces cinnabarinus TaxID=67287 RepID=A0ABY7KBB0_9ACTN|nr:hypothetical protein [Streptomyces cinnabarinus]WAZ21796.1 hypothetical protein STRCI_002995 [Streptomyces cinnabarinus]
MFIDGPDPTAERIERRLVGHPRTEVLRLEPAGNTSARRASMAAADLTVLCRPATEAPEAADLAGRAGSRILDLSSAHRTTCGWIYGLPELTRSQRPRIMRGHAVAQPDGRAVATALLLRPLIAVGLLDAKSPCRIAGGAAGGDVLPEVVKWTRLAHKPEFEVNPLADDDIHVTIGHEASASLDALRACLAEAHRDEQHLRVAATAAGTTDATALTLSVHPDTDGRVRLTARMPTATDWVLDLTLRNINLMLGLPENLGVAEEARQPTAR